MQHNTALFALCTKLWLLLVHVHHESFAGNITVSVFLPLIDDDLSSAFIRPCNRLVK